MYSPKDEEQFTLSIEEKFATSLLDATECQRKFMKVHDIVYNYGVRQKRKEWRLQGSSSRAFASIEDLIYMWYNMDVTLPDESYQHIIMHPTSQLYPLPYLPQSLRVKLYPLLGVKTAGIRQMCRSLGAVPPNPTFSVDLEGHQVELSAVVKVQTQSCRRVAIEIWKKEANARKERMRAEDMKCDVVREIRTRVHCELQPAYMNMVSSTRKTPAALNLRGISLRAHKLDYGNHDADPGPYKYKKTMSGTFTQHSLVTLFEHAEMGPNTIFLDIGSGLCEPMIAAATGFQVMLSLGFEVHKDRLEQGLRSIIEKGVSRAFPIHASAEEVSHFDPVTHVYCYTNGMDSMTRNCIRESIISSKSVQFVMTDREELLEYPGVHSQFKHKIQYAHDAGRVKW